MIKYQKDDDRRRGRNASIIRTPFLTVSGKKATVADRDLARMLLLLSIIIFMALAHKGCRSIPLIESQEMRLREVAPIISRIDPASESVAVSWICEADTYNITSLGNVWRDRIEGVFSDQGIKVKGRGEICIVLDDIDAFGPRRDENELWTQAGAEVVVTGHYRVIEAEAPGSPDVIKLLVKALRVEGLEVIGTAEWSEPLPPDWRRLAAVRHGNAYHKKLDNITPPDSVADKPRLTARMDRADACYATGDTGEIRIASEAGVYIYLLNLTADGTVTLLYPNRLCPAKALSGDTFVFPSSYCKEKMEIVFYPAEPGSTSRESVVAVASRESLDFSFLPVPINHVFSGAEGGDIKKVYDILDGAKAWSEAHLSYTVGYECEILR